MNFGRSVTIGLNPSHYLRNFVLDFPSLKKQKNEPGAIQRKYPHSNASKFLQSLVFPTGPKIATFFRKNQDIIHTENNTLGIFEK